MTVVASRRDVAAKAIIPRPVAARMNGSPVIEIPGRQYHSLHSPASSRPQLEAFKAGNEGRYDIQVTSMTIPICRVLHRKETWEEKLLQPVSRGNDLRNIWVSHFRLRKALSTHLLRIHGPNDIHRP